MPANTEGRDAAAHQERIDAILFKHRHAIAGSCHAHTSHTPLDELIAAEEATAGDTAGDTAGLRLECFHALLNYFFADGPHPLKLIRRIYAIAKALRPELIGHMPLEDLSLLSGDAGGRATVQARIKLIYNKFIEKNGGRDIRAPFQKTVSASLVYAASQKGNSNRRKK